MHIGAALQQIGGKYCNGHFIFPLRVTKYAKTTILDLKLPMCCTAFPVPRSISYKYCTANSIRKCLNWQTLLNMPLFQFLLTALSMPPFPSKLPRILRPWGSSRVATMNPTWHAGNGAIWSRPWLAIRPGDSIPTLAAWCCLMSTYEQTLDCQVATSPRHGGQAGFCHCCSNPGASKGGLRFPK